MIEPGPVAFVVIVWARSPGQAHVRVVVEVVDELVSLQDHYFEVAVIAASEVALDDRTRAGGSIADALAALPRQVHVRVVVKPVPKLVSLQDHHLEVAVIAASEVALDDRTRAGGSIADALAALPRQVHVRVVVKPVPKLVSLQDHHLEVAVIAAPEVALDDRARSRGSRWQRLSHPPLDAAVAWRAEEMVKLSVAEEDRFEIRVVARPEVALNDAVGPNEVRHVTFLRDP